MIKVAFAAVVVLLAFVVPGAAQAADGITASCTSGGVTADCGSGWYTSDVSVSFTLPAGSSNPLGCGNQMVSSDTAGVTFTCTVAVTGSQCCRLDVTIRRDATPPIVSSLVPQRGPDANGWYNHAVGFTASGSDATSGIASCTSTSYGGPDSSSASVSATCTDNAGNVSAPVSASSFRYDATAPSVTASPSRSPDTNGWYNHPLDVSFKGSDTTSGIGSCTSGSYSGPDNGSASVTGTCTDQAGNVGTAALPVKYDSTPPAVSTATPDRQPDADGFYNHKVTVTFAGTDATSGIASCDTASYEKPDSATAKLTGVCRDNAGNVSAPGSFAFKYDSTPPKLTDLTSTVANGSVTLAWKPSPDVASTVVTRTVGGADPKTVYSGKRTASFVDKTVKNGNHYAYTVAASDEAGNTVTLKTTALPSAALIAPRQQAQLHGSAAVTLRWRPVARTDYYNVQLWYGKTKLLSAWPSATSYTITPSWSYLGRSYRLAPGRYTWLVWPGHGSKNAHRFGKLLGQSSFVITVGKKKKASAAG